MKVSIVGGSPSTEHDHPNEGEVWIHGNQMDRHLDCHVTRVFEIHDDLSNQDPNYPEWLVKQCNHKGAKLITGKGFPLQVSGVEVYPFDKVLSILPLLTSTPAYMMGLAILEGANIINIYGVDMAVDDFEYFYQRPAMYAWISYARAKGIEVNIPDESSLFRDSHIEGQTQRGKPPFSMSEFNDIAEMHQAQMNECQRQIELLQAKIQTHDGARQAYSRLAKVARAVEAGIDVQTLTETVRVNG